MRVVRLQIAPVKGLGAVEVERVRIGRAGVEEDRCFFLVDVCDDVVTLRRHPELAPVRPRWEPAAGVLALALPGGEEVRGEVALGERVATELYGRARVGREVAGPFAGALSALAGEPVRLVLADEPGMGWDEGPVSIVSSASLDAVARADGLGAVDPRRFRMLVEVDGPDAFGEDRWIGSAVRVGGATVQVAFAVERCSIVTFAPDDGERDWDALRALARLRGRDHVCLGVAATVLRPGEVALGDPIELS